MISFVGCLLCGGEGRAGGRGERSGADSALGSARAHAIRRELDLTAPDTGMRLVPTELWVGRRRILPSGTWDGADPDRNSVPVPEKVACLVRKDFYRLRKGRCARLKFRGLHFGPS